jgi:hypothetical protein
MTLSARNRLLGVGIGLSFLLGAGFAVNAPAVWKAAPAALAAASVRSTGLLQNIGGLLARPSAYAWAAAVATCVLYAFITLGLLYYLFEKTQAPEILFFAFFALSFSLETLRCAIPLGLANDWPPAYAASAARILAFGRLFGLFALFTASVYAGGMNYQKHGRVLVIIGVVALLIASRLPLDGSAWTSAAGLVPGYASMAAASEYAIAAIACLSFLVAAFTRGAPEFAYLGVGSLAALIGREGLLNADNWISFPLAALALAAGTWLTTRKIHAYYLWL